MDALKYAQGLAAHMDEGGKVSNGNTRDLIHFVEQLSARLAAAEEENSELKKRIGALCAYPLCECGSGSFCKVLDGPIPDFEERDSLALKLAAAEKVVEAARIALRFMERGTMSVGIQYEIGVQLKEALTAYQEHSDGR